MASSWKLPQELADQIIQHCFDHLWRHLPETEMVLEEEILEFLHTRRVCCELYIDTVMRPFEIVN